MQQFIESDTVFAGTPDDVFDQIKAFSDSIGGFGHLLMFGQGGFLDHADTVENITLFAKEVLPRLRELNPEPKKLRSQQNSRLSTAAWQVLRQFAFETAARNWDARRDLAASRHGDAADRPGGAKVNARKRCGIFRYCILNRPPHFDVR